MNINNNKNNNDNNISMHSSHYLWWHTQSFCRCMSLSYRVVSLTVSTRISKNLVCASSLSLMSRLASWHCALPLSLPLSLTWPLLLEAKRERPQFCPVEARFAILELILTTCGRGRCCVNELRKERREERMSIKTSVLSHPPYLKSAFQRDRSRVFSIYKQRHPEILLLKS